MADQRKIILASSSPYRRALLKRLDLSFRSARPGFDERDPEPGETPSAYTRAMAERKARSLAGRHPSALILGSDQIAVCDGEILRKPGTGARAVRQLLKLAGREHRLITAVALVDAPSGQARTEVVVNRLRVRPLTRAEARAYVERERPLDCAGAYKTEGLGVTLFDYMRGDDPTALIGLPLISVRRLLNQAGISLPASK
ncbi:MAG: septum formation protein Maf [Candidatus Eisenbacteria bacterium]|nr:septum formation protein Maf [Candidatus Eisenbacteria bacterium]